MLTSLALLFFLAFSLGYVFNKLHLPSLLGMLLAGILLGQSGFSLLDDKIMSISTELRQIALVIILLRAGLALKLSELKQVGRPAVLLSFVPATIEICGIMLLAPALLDVNLFEAALIGSVVAAVSPAVVVPRMLSLMQNKVGTRKGIPQMLMASGSVDDIFVIVLFSSFVILCGTGEFSALSLLDIPISIVLGILLGILGGLAINLVFKFLKFRNTIKMLLTLGLGFLFLSLEQLLKGTVAVSALLGVMVMGITILKKDENLAGGLSGKFNSMWVGAEVILFALVGAEVNLDYALSFGFTPVLVLLGALCFRMLGVYLSVVGTKLNSRERLFCMIAYLPKATVQAAIGSIALSMGLPCGDMVLTLAVLAILISAPLGAVGIDLSYKKLLK
ncbi:MAG: cation:proton antiporter [Rikenellaceae bacterium]